MSNPTFSVILPTYHRNELLAKCLDCLKPGVQTLSAEQYEVVVTDDGRTKTAEQLIQEQYPWVKWVAGPHKGPAANRNNGARVAEGEWLVFTDDDCLPDTQWLAAYAEAIAQYPEYSVLEGRTYVDRPQQSLAEKSPTNETGGYLWSCNLAMQKALFESLKGFDERFPYAAMEDVDLRLRLTQLGQHFLFVKNAAICHPWRISGGWQELKRHQKSTFIYLSIHPEEAIRINSVYYLKFTFNTFLRNTLPGLFRLKGKGLETATLEHIAFVNMSFLLWLNPWLLYLSKSAAKHETD
jgi:GT2 family glycosyltransferase